MRELIRSLKLKKFIAKREFIRFFKEVDPSTKIEEVTFVVLDTETTSLKTREAQVVSVGALKIRNMSISLAETFYKFVRIQNLNYKSVEVHGITPQDLAVKAEDPQKVTEEFLNYIKGTVLVGFNVRFDIEVMEKLTQRYFGIPILNRYVEVLNLWKRRGGLPKDLKAMAEELGIPSRGLHSAIDDAYTTALIFLKLISKMRGEPLKYIL